ncbi:transglutaminase domain-containing protein [Brachybacterium sp. EF45031]|uniref:transglutaminase family protein n=1 Tax=Brachybacterium sillae TaxID=2810536 RepID=UPI00217D6A61|nr:transglutaminase domain-containing protein [Brachybacterium sillae]MCS6711482.1 transglutaminase domain-containing protein [Brachybacterium sillae]
MTTPTSTTAPVTAVPSAAGVTVLRAALLMGAVLLASTPFSLLLQGGNWLLCLLVCLLVQVPLTALLRILRVRPVPSTLVQATALVLIVVGGLILLGRVPLPDAPARAPATLERVITVLREGAEEFAQGVAPLAVDGPGLLLVLIVSGCAVMSLALLYLELDLDLPPALVLLAAVLVPALMNPTSMPWSTVAGPALGALLLWCGPTPPRPGGGPQAGPAVPRLPRRTALATVGSAAGIAALAPLLTDRLPVPRARIPVDVDVVNAWLGRPSAALDPQMIDDTISVRRDLLRAEETELLRITTPADPPGYVRLRTLTRFDGVVFSAGPPGGRGRRRRRADDWASSLTDTALDDGPDDTLVPYDITVTALTSDRLPVPQDPIRWTDAPLPPQTLQDPRSGELRLPSPEDLSGRRYTVQVLPPGTPTPQDLAAVAYDDPQLAVPLQEGYVSAVDVPEVLRDLAATVTREAGATTPWEAARALVDHFTAYDYSLTIRTRPDEDPLESFLRDRIGYCEQFAACFALAMTSLGAPARVAIGFTSGTAQGEQRVITNHHAHAWPEVWFGPEAGWVRFEPTPAAAGNGVTDPERGADEPAAAPEPSPSSQAPSPSPSSSAAETPSSEAAEPSASAEAEPTAGTDGGAGGDGGGDVLGVLGGLATIGAAAGAVLLRRRGELAAREGRWEQASTAEDPTAAAAHLAWQEIARQAERRDRRRPGGDGAVLDAALPEREALTGMLERLETEGVEVTEAHRAAASRIAEAIVRARYAPPPARDGYRAPTDDSGEAPREARAAARALREDAERLTELLRQRPRPAERAQPSAPSPNLRS